jgi:hypothetical protein
VIRILLTLVLPFLLPSALYLLWLAAMRRTAFASGWGALPWSWLLGAGVVLTALILFIVSVQFGNAPGGTYIPPRVVGGQLEPAHVVPPPPRP